ncbi:MAG: serine protease [Bacteroidota bacterium]
MGFFEAMEGLEKAFWFMALPASLIFVIQTIMTFAGVDSTDGVDADFNGDLDGAEAPFQLFSLRNLVNFFLGFSWSGISFYHSISNRAILIGICLAIGILFVYLFFVIIRQVQKLAEDNSFHIQHAVGKTATVYLRIPASKSGYGKIQVSVNGTSQELNAMTNDEEIPSGTIVRVLEVLDNNLLLVSIL